MVTLTSGAARRRRTRARAGGGRVSVRRRIAVATWRPSRDGRIYARVEVDATAMEAYIEQIRLLTGERVSVTHIVGAALGRALREVPEVRARVVFGRIVELASCDVGFAVDIDGDQLSPRVIARQLSDGAARLRAGQDRAHRRSSLAVRLAPTWVLQLLMPLIGLLSGGLGVGVLGQPGFPLGTGFVSNVGSLGLDEAFLAPVPFARVPLYLAVGSTRDAAVVVDGAVVVRRQLVIVATADHRLIDGAHAGRLVTFVRALLADPAQLESPASPAPIG
jgi:pyruvate/2-oxoglutarate dehydrogenase complex dihydrolipoamide acyltransferase (E2) component